MSHVDRGAWRPCLFSIGLIILAIQAGDSKGQTLEDALVSAYLNNPSVAAQRAALRATDEQVPQARSGFRPNLSFQASIARSDDPSFDNNQSSMIVSQNLFRGGRDLANLLRAKALVRAERARLLATEQTAMLDTVTAYVSLLNDAAVLALATEQIKRLQQQLEGIEGRFSIGEVARTDVAQAEASVADAMAIRDRAAGALEISKARYEAVVRKPPMDPLTPPRPIDTLPETLAIAEEMALASNPNIHAAKANLLAARQDVRVAEAALYPQASLEGVVNYVEQLETNVKDSSASIRAEVTLPLFQGGGEYAAIRRNKDTLDQREADLDVVITTVRVETTSAWQGLKTARSNVRSITEQIRAATIALDGSREEALLGERSTLDVLAQEAALFQAEVDLVGAQRDEIISSYQLTVATGQLTADRLKLPVQIYDPLQHYNDVRRW